MRWILANPRGHVASAEIVEEDPLFGLGPSFFLSYRSTYGGRHGDTTRSFKSAKALFSRCVLKPKYPGKNIWQEKA